MSQTRTVIFARQSLDRTGEGAAVDRQVAACRNLADARGWTVTETLVENDTSASGKVARPVYAQLLRLMRARQVDVVIVWHIDRLTRRVIDLEELIAVVESTGVKVATVTGDLDLSTDTGQTVGRILATVAQGEVKRKAARQRLANEQRAQNGHMGWTTMRPFGYVRDENGRTVVAEDEAKGLEAAAEMILAGGNLSGAARMLTARGLLTTAGNEWTATPLRRTLLNPRYSGRVTYNGVDVTAGDWPIILPADVQERLSEKLRDVRRRMQQGSDPKWLLSGVARCGRCGKTMIAGRVGGRMSYRCECGLARRQEHVDAVVEAVVLARLSRPDAAVVFADAEDVPKLRAEVAELRGRRDDLAGLLADGLLSASAVRERSADLTKRITALEDRISEALGESPVMALVSSDDVSAAWSALSVRQRKSVVALLMTVEILPVGKGARVFDPEQVRITWK